MKNPVAKHLRTYNKSKVFVDRKRESKAGIRVSGNHCSECGERLDQTGCYFCRSGR